MKSLRHRVILELYVLLGDMEVVRFLFYGEVPDLSAYPFPPTTVHKLPGLDQEHLAMAEHLVAARTGELPSLTVSTWQTRFNWSCLLCSD